MLKAVDLVATNVPGLERPVSLAGADVEAQFAFAPPSGAACSLALHSYADALTLGVLVDAAAVPDLAVLSGCLQAGIDEVATLGRRTRTTRARAAAS
jgi:hypothetical protein